MGGCNRIGFYEEKKLRELSAEAEERLPSGGWLLGFYLKISFVLVNWTGHKRAELKHALKNVPEIATSCIVDQVVQLGVLVNL